MKIVAAADGSALGNPGPAGWAWIIDDKQWQSGGWKRATNNQAELMAVLSLLNETAATQSSLHILCDSRYVIDSLTKWMPGWKRKGWRKSDGKPVLNLELLQQLDEALTGRDVSFEWVRGHTGHELNERADDLARAAASDFQLGVRHAGGPGFISNANCSTERSASRVTSDDQPDLFVAPQQSSSPTLFELSDQCAPEGLHALPFKQTLKQRASDCASSLTTNNHTLLLGFLHTDIEGIDAYGSILTDAADVATYLRTSLQQPSTSEVHSISITPQLVQMISTEAVMLNNTSPTPVRRVTLWVFDNDVWVIRFIQDTPLPSADHTIIRQ